MKSAAYLFFVLLPLSLLSADGPSIGRYSRQAHDRVAVKVREALSSGGEADLKGVVTLSGDDRFFMQDGASAVKVLYAGKLPAAGEAVTVRGRPSLEGGRIVLVAHSWTGGLRGEVPAARAVGAADLVDGSVFAGVNGLRVAVEGRAMGRTETGVALSVDNVPVNVMASDLPSFLDDCARTHPKVRVTGVAELMLDPSALLGREGYVMGVKVNVDSADDIVLEEDLDYLEAKHERTVLAVGLALLGLLAAGLVVFLVVVFRQRRGLFRTRTIMAERKRMADDIHDTIEQHLVGAGMLLKVNRLKEAQDVLVRAKRELRDIVWGLKNDDMMRQTPAEMLRALAHEENTKGLYRVDTRLEGLPAAMDAAAMRDLSLVVRESIGNAVKHGGAKKIAISADALPGGGWTLRLSNDGAPFDPATAPGAKEGHFGLEGMRERARRLGATVRFEPRGSGMMVVLEKRLALVLAALTLATAGFAGERMTLIVNEPAEHFFVASSKAAVGETEGRPNAFANLGDFAFPADVTCTAEGAERYVDALAGGNLTHLFINVNYQRAFYPSKVFEPIWVSLDEPGRQKQPFIRAMREAFDCGFDVYAVLMRRCRERGVSPWLSIRMNDIHGTQTKSDPMVSTFWKEHPEWHLNKDEGWANGLDYAEKAVRDRMAALIREAVARYDADGVELDLIRFPFYFRAGTEKANAPLLTAFVREVRAICEAAAVRRGHPVKVAVRLLPDPRQAEKMGADVGTWAREGLVDMVIPCNMYGSVEYEYRLGDWRKLLGEKVRLVAGTDNGIVENGRRRVLNLREYRRWIGLMRQGGADGVYFFNFPLRPYRDETWREIL